MADIPAARHVVTTPAAVMVADLPEEDTAVGHQAAAIPAAVRAVVIPEAGRAAAISAEVPRHRAAVVVRQDAVAANSSRSGSRPTPTITVRRLRRGPPALPENTNGEQTT